MNKLINIILITALALGFACKDKSESDELKTNFEPSPQLVGTNTESTKAAEDPTITNSYSALTATPNMGLYVVSEKLALQPSGNTYDNVECVNTAGKFAPVKNLYYPSEQFGVKLKAYIPYTASLADPSALPVTVKADQSVAANVKVSDFLFGSTTTVTPGIQKVPVELKHAFTLLHVTVEVPSKFIDRTVTSCTGVVIMNSPTAGTVNLAPDVPTVTPNASTKTTITPIKIAQTGTAPNPTLYTYEAVVLPQAIAAGTPMFAVELTFGDALGNEVFVYQPKDDLTLISGGWHTLKLKVADFGKLTLSSATINQWTTSNLYGTLSEMGVANTFDITIFEPNTNLFTQAADFVVTSKIKGVKVVTSTGSSHKLVNVLPNSASNSQILKFQASFGADAPARYDFRINTVQLYSDAACTALICSYNLSQTISGGGTLPLVLYPYSGVGGVWNPGGWGSVDVGGKYDKSDILNLYKIVFYNASASSADPANSATTAKLYIGANLAYTITMGTMTPAGDSGTFSASMANYVSPTAGTTPPTQYPFTFSKIVITTVKGEKTINATGDEWQIEGQGKTSLFIMN